MKITLVEYSVVLSRKKTRKKNFCLNYCTENGKSRRKSKITEKFTRPHRDGNTNTEDTPPADMETK